MLSLLLIFGLTFQDCRSSEAMTHATQNVIEHGTNASQTVSHWWDDYILMRKLGHIPEYFLLGLSAGYGMRSWWKA